jgi:hypothetical protein
MTIASRTTRNYFGGIRFSKLKINFQTSCVECQLGWPKIEPMTTYTIIPRDRRYWIEAIARDGSREFVERFDTEDAAVREYRALQAKAGIVDRWNSPQAPKPQR